MLSETWEHQYKRMHRSYEHLKNAVGQNIGLGPELHDEASSRDILFHFFGHAFHLKEYVENEAGQTPTIKRSVKDLFDPGHTNGSTALSICADIANGVEHLNLKWSRFNPPAEVGKQAAGNLLPATLPIRFAYHFTIEADGNTYTEIQVADDAIADWDRWLAGNGFSVPSL